MKVAAVIVVAAQGLAAAGSRTTNGQLQLANQPAGSMSQPASCQLAAHMSSCNCEIDCVCMCVCESRQAM